MHCAHTNTHTPTSCREHVHTFTLLHTGSVVCFQGEIVKVRCKPHSKLKTLSVLFSFTHNWTAAVSEPCRLSPANVVDFIYGQCASLGPVVQVKLSIALHSVVSHIQLLCTEVPRAIISSSSHHLL